MSLPKRLDSGKKEPWVSLAENTLLADRQSPARDTNKKSLAKLGASQGFLKVELR